MAGSKNRPWLHLIAFVCALTFSIDVTVDIEYPRAGLVRIDAADQILADLRNSMN